MRDLLRMLLVAAAVLLLGAVAWRLIFGADDLAPLTVERVDGDVVLIGTSGVQPATPGMVLERSERITTEAGGRAVLGIGEETRLVLHAASTLRVLGQDEEGVRVELEGGRVQATVRPGSGAVGVLTDGREVRATDASFSVGLTEEGTTIVEDNVGEIELRGFGELTSLNPGQRVIAMPDAAPQLDIVPDSLLLQVEWPEQVKTRASTVTIRGRTDPGARVRVRGGEGEVTALADPDGGFELQIALAEGVNDLDLAAVDALGQEQQVSWTITRDSTAPPATFEIP
ncbi:MAG: FecR domain-containing protein [Alphaproteobacteria bacterium]|nr:FecR domain-containing protein [Alphaproteobacteria bacterium]